MKVHHQSSFERWLFESESVQVIVTSPPFYSLRRYSIPDIIIGGREDCQHEWGDKIIGCRKCNAFKGQYGLEPTYQLYIDHTLLWAKEAWRVLKPNGIFFLNLGDSYSGMKIGNSNKKWESVNTKDFVKQNQDIPSKCKLLIPHRVAIGLIEQGWILRSDIVWHSSNKMPESVKDRPTKSYEFIFMFVKSSFPTCWRHDETKQWVWKKPEPDYIWINKKTGEKVKKEPDNWRTLTYSISDAEIQDEIDDAVDMDEKPPETKIRKLWGRKNLWESHDYYFDMDAIKEKCVTPVDSKAGHTFGGKKNDTAYKAKSNMPGKKWEYSETRQIRDVWIIPTQPSSEQHYAMWPSKLVERMILCSTKPGDIVLDPFAGSGTTLRVADRLNRVAFGIDLGYEDIQRKRLSCIQKELI